MPADIHQWRRTPNLRPPQVQAKNINLTRSSIKESPYPASSSSFNSSSPDFLRNVQAAFKRRLRPLNTTHASSLIPRRILLPQRETTKNADKSSFFKARETVSVFNEIREDASITSPSDSGIMTNTFEDICNQKPCTICKDGNANIITFTESRHIPLVEGSSNSTSQEGDDQMATEMGNLCSHMDSLALAETEWDTSNQAESADMINNEEKLHVSQYVDMDVGLRADGVSSSFVVRKPTLHDQLDHLRSFLLGDGTHPMTQSSVCATSISVHATSAPRPSLTTICPSSCLEQGHGRMVQQSHLSANLSDAHIPTVLPRLLRLQLLVFVSMA